MLRTCGALVAAVTATFVLGGCGGSSPSGPTGAVSPQPVATSVPACPTPGQVKHVVWPAKVPSDLPKPPNATLNGQLSANDGVHIVKFTTPTSLRESVLFIVEKLPKAGYVLGRGDAEATEADAPFLHGSVRGLMRLVELGHCQTQWLLATVSNQAPTTGSPLLPPHTPSGSPSPLPFG